MYIMSVYLLSQFNVDTNEVEDVLGITTSEDVLKYFIPNSNNEDDIRKLQGMLRISYGGKSIKHKIQKRKTRRKRDKKKIKRK